MPTLRGDLKAPKRCVTPGLANCGEQIGVFETVIGFIQIEFSDISGSLQAVGITQVNYRHKVKTISTSGTGNAIFLHQIAATSHHRYGSDNFGGTLSR